MPVNFLTEAQRARYGRFNTVPDEAQLGAFFHLDADARRLAMGASGPRNRLGMALQLTTVRFLGTFLADPADVPTAVVDFVAAQLGLSPDDLKGYEEKKARWEHQKKIREAYGYTLFGPEQWLSLGIWAYRRSWAGNERPSVLFDLATNRLVEAKVLLPGVTTLERLIAGVRERVALRQFKLLASAPTAEQRTALEALVTVAEGKRVSQLDRYRKSPTDISGKGVVKALDRHADIRSLGASTWDLSSVPPGRVLALARFAKAARAQAVAQLGEDRKTATLVAFAATLEPASADEAVEVFDLLIGDLVRTAAHRAKQARIRTIKDLDAAALILREAWLKVADSFNDPDSDLRAIIAAMDTGRVDEAATTVGQVARQPDEDAQTELMERAATIRRFLPKLLRTLDFDHGDSPAGAHVIDALDFVRTLPRRRTAVDPATVPAAFLTPAWRRRVFPAAGPHAGGFDPDAYTVAAAERLRESLRRHEVFVPGLGKWGDPTAGLLSGAAWQAARPGICRDLGLSHEPGADIDRWAHMLDGAYRQLAAGMEANPSLRVEQREGRDHLVLSGLDKLDDPPSLTALREDVAARIPVVDFTEVLLEVHSWTGCLDRFTHVGGDVPSRKEDMLTSIAAVLCAQAMNTGMRPMVSETSQALSLDRLFWTEQHYIREATLTAANADLVDYHSGLQIVAAWGGGELASADGMRFVVPVKTINAGPNTKYFGKGKGAKGVTYYNFTSDQFTGFHGIVIPGTPKDWYYILEGLLEQETSLRPTEITSDTAGASEIAFGIFRLMGWQFSPRLADAGSATLYRTDPSADYGPLNTLTRSRINTGLITDAWDDLLRVAASLRSGAVKASELFRYLAGGGTPTPIGRALMELGRLDRSIYLASYFDDELLRRRVNTQLNRQEARHTLARRIFHGQKGELRQRYREGMEDQLGALGFMVNVAILWNTVYTARAVEQIRAEGTRVHTADIARLSPLGCEHFNMLGKYSFSLAPEIGAGQLRPLRSPHPGS